MISDTTWVLSFCAQGKGLVWGPLTSESTLGISVFERLHPEVDSVSQLPLLVGSFTN